MGFSTGGVWVTGYDRPMGYGMHFSAHQVGGLILLWDITGYGFSKVWVITGSTVVNFGGPGAVLKIRQLMYVMIERQVLQFR